MLRRLTPIAALVLLACAAPAGARPTDPEPARAAQPRHQLLGDWRVKGGGFYRFSRRRGRVEGRTRRTLRIGRCTIGRNSVVFRGYRFARRRGRSDIWRGRVAFVRDGCRRVFARSTIAVRSDLRFSEVARLDGRRRRSGPFRRVRPRVRAGDRVVATWVRNSVGVVVSAARGGYEGRAREAYLIGNGCTIPAGTLVWRIQPLAPGRYDGTVQTFRDPRNGCRPGSQARSRWRLGSRERLVRISAGGDAFAYERG